MRTAWTGPVIGPIALVALLAALTGTVGLSGLGWLVGLSCGATTSAALARGLARSGAESLGPANRVTLGRAVVVGGVAALVADSFTGTTPVRLLVTLASVALVLDAIDGAVARRTRTTSGLGARFDTEVDAFLILVLSVYVAGATDLWVLVIGAARYAFVVAGWVLSWLRALSPPRYWCKVVAAIQGIVLTVATADVLSPALTRVVLAASLALLAESFGREAWWLWRHRYVDPGSAVGRQGAPARRERQAAER